MCFILKTELLCRQRRGIVPHLTARAKSNGFSRVAEGTLDIFSISAGMIFKARVCSATSGLLSSYEGHLKNIFEAWQGNRDAS